MKLLLVAAGLLAGGAFYSGNSGFLASQRQFPRMNAAFANHSAAAEDLLLKNAVPPQKINMLLVAYKTEKQLELHVKAQSETKYRKLKTYNVCRLSGKPGPKRLQGDGQIPEGFYEINRFHPESKYHLSLGLNYPNQSDKILSDAHKPGGDIFIHGKCVTIGCLPMTDAVMEEIYVYAVLARESGQQTIPVYIFPARPGSEAFALYQHLNRDDEELLAFWENLNEGHAKFTATSQALAFTVNDRGRYVFK